MHHITFTKATAYDKPIIHDWWTKPHVMEFWDNSPEMWRNAENFLDYGIVDIFHYWVASCDDVPFALVMSSVVDGEYAAKEGVTYSIDFMIGNEDYLGKGLASETLKAFMRFCPDEVKSFIIDPDMGNSKAVHVYRKAGFVDVEKFIPTEGSFKGIEHIMMRCDR